MKQPRERPGPVVLLRALVVSLIMIATIGFMLRMYMRGATNCPEALTYRIGAVDERFGLSPEEVAGALHRAASIWNSAAARELVAVSDTGVVEIGFVYDYRQEASENLKGISANIDNTKGSYDTLKAHLAALDEDLKRKKASFERDLESYNTRVSAFNSQSDPLSHSGSASADVIGRLKSEKDSLDALHADLATRREELNRIVDTMNSMVVVINQIACNLNLDVVKYNNTGQRLMNEFSEGLYESRNGRRTITIYHFTSPDRLVRILAHELGHALGLPHSDNPEALMYRLNQSDSLTLAPDDIAALQARCNRN